MENEQGGNDERGSEGDGQEITHLSIGKHFFEAPLDDEQIEQREVDSRENHKHGGYQLKTRRMEISEAGLMGGESASGHRREGMVDSIESRHAAQMIGHDTAQGERHVNDENPACRGADAGMEFVELQARSLSREEFEVASAHRREDGNGEENDSHTSKPMRDAAP